MLIRKIYLFVTDRVLVDSPLRQHTVGEILVKNEFCLIPIWIICSKIVLLILVNSFFWLGIVSVLHLGWISCLSKGTKSININ